MKRAMLTLFLSLIMIFSAQAAPTDADVRTAVNAITDASISAIAAFLNTPALALPGMTIGQGPNDSLPTQITLKDADLGAFIDAFVAVQPQKSSFFSSLLSAARGPLNDLALQVLRMHGWQRGHVLLTGSATTEWAAGLNLATLMSKAITGSPMDPVTVKAAVLVTGTRLSTAVHLDGVFVIESSPEGVITIGLRSLDINGMTMVTAQEE